VRRLDRWDRHCRLEFVALQEAAHSGRPILVAVAGSRDLAASLHVVDESTGAVAAAGRAFLEIVAVLPGGRWPARLASLPPAVWLVELGYRLVARNRPAIGRLLGL
jgi:predicted DCC family thiol-disulfide oxidoreductase YuxK